MKSSKYIMMASLLLLGLTSCKKFLDVNTDVDNPNNQSVLIQNRLPWIEHFYQYTAGVTNHRTSCLAGVYYCTAANQNTFSTTWNCTNGNSTTSYQTWFVEVSSNLVDLYNSAQKQNAYHYMAVSNVFHALGYMEMLDLYGEMPYTEAGTGNPSPKPDDGKTIFKGCMSKLNEAIDLFSKAQPVGVPTLAAGDLWNNGDVNKWIKMCWGLKARYMLKLSKKAEFNADSVLYCLSKGPQSISDNVVGPGFNNSTVTDYLLGDPVVTNGNFDYVGYGSTNRISQYYYNLLTNMRNSGVTDPRMAKIVPAAMSNIQLDATGKVSSYTWLRSIGVDSYGPATRLLKGGATTISQVTYATAPLSLSYNIADPTDRGNFITAQTAAGHNFVFTPTGTTVAVYYKAGSHYVNSTNYVLSGDTTYVNLRSSAIATSGIPAQGQSDVSWYQSAAAFTAGAVASTGSYQVRPVSDQEILTYHEMCFIKAEVYLRKGDAGNALTAYKAGIQAHLDMMQAKLTSWKAAGYSATNPDMAPMVPADITTYMGSTAVAQAGVTMADIMLQKYLAMGCSIENWNDMRRFNFSAGGTYGVVYPGYQRGPLFTGQAQLTGGSPTDVRYWIRRWALPPTYEINYNAINTLALNAHATDVNIWSMPVWWDCATDDEYYAYLKK